MVGRGRKFTLIIVFIRGLIAIDSIASIFPKFKQVIISLGY